jgi:hypothetical protein
MSTVQRKTNEGYTKVAIVKSFNDSSKSFVSPDFANKSTWFFNSISVVDEIATTSDNSIYQFASGSNITVIDLDNVTDRRVWASKGISIKKNDIVITTGFVVNPNTKIISFQVPNEPSDIIKISYNKENGSMFEVISSPGKKVLIDYVESQFSAGTTFNDSLMFQLLINTPATGNQDYVVASMEYKNAKDFLNIGNHGTVMEPFGELTQKVNVFPWNYLTGFTIKPIGDETTNPNKNEFNKIKMYLKNDQPFTNCELACGTFYCYIEDL